MLPKISIDVVDKKLPQTHGYVSKKNARSQKLITHKQFDLNKYDLKIRQKL